MHLYLITHNTFILTSLQLEQLNAEAASRAKRERRKANEVKQKTIQRMQLQMTAPLDIGLEQTDAVLSHGQEDMFDLKHAEQIPGRKSFHDLDDTDTDDEDTEPDENKNNDNSGDEALYTDEEPNGRMHVLENDLDDLYETYRERIAERDAKAKVRDARKNDKRREEWSGFDRDEAQTDTDEDDEDGGWYEMEQRRARDDESDSSSSTDEEDELSAPPLSKRKQLHQQEMPRKKARLLTSLEEPQTASQTSRKANVWFSQDIFDGLDTLDENDDGEVNSPRPSSDVEVRFSPLSKV
jgi:AdoMet-dependent rRNA methyltransferase SPB1